MNTLQLAAGKRVDGAQSKLITFSPSHGVQSHFNAPRRVPVRRTTQENDLQGRELKWRHRLLRQHRPVPRQVANCPFLDRFAIKTDAARRGTQLTAKQLQESGFSGAIRSQHRDNFSRAERKVDVGNQGIYANLAGILRRAASYGASQLHRAL